MYHGGRAGQVGSAQLAISGPYFDAAILLPVTLREFPRSGQTEVSHASNHSTMQRQIPICSFSSWNTNPDHRELRGNRFPAHRSSEVRLPYAYFRVHLNLP